MLDGFDFSSIKSEFLLLRAVSSRSRPRIADGDPSSRPFVLLLLLSLREASSGKCGLRPFGFCISGNEFSLLKDGFRVLDNVLARRWRFGLVVLSPGRDTKLSRIGTGGTSSFRSILNTINSLQAIQKYRDSQEKATMSVFAIRVKPKRGKK